MYEKALSALKSKLAELRFDFSELKFEYNEQRSWWWFYIQRSVKVTWPNGDWETLDIDLALKSPEVAAREVVSMGLGKGYFPWGTKPL